MILKLQVILPALLEQSHTRTWLKWLVHWWCGVVAGALGLRSYLLGSGPGPSAGPEPGPAGPGGGLGAAHQALLQREGPTGWQPYERPSAFPARLAALLVLVCFSLVIASSVALVSCSLHYLNIIQHTIATKRTLKVLHGDCKFTGKIIFNIQILQ